MAAAAYGQFERTHSCRSFCTLLTMIIVNFVINRAKRQIWISFLDNSLYNNYKYVKLHYVF